MLAALKRASEDTVGSLRRFATSEHVDQGAFTDPTVAEDHDIANFCGLRGKRLTSGSKQIQSFSNLGSNITNLRACLRHRVDKISLMMLTLVDLGLGSSISIANIVGNCCGRGCYTASVRLRIEESILGSTVVGRSMLVFPAGPLAETGTSPLAEFYS